MRDPDIILGEPGAELRAIQLISLTLADTASWANDAALEGCHRVVVPPLLLAAARALSLASTAGLQTPIEVLALSARNTLELWLRLKHVLTSDTNCQRWRNENLTDQVEVYEAVLTLPGPETAKEQIRDEIGRVTNLATGRSLELGSRPLMARELARQTGESEDYAAFYKLYSKLVHPSSWWVNSPTAVATPMYRQTLVVNAQIYGWRILRLVEERFGVPVEQCYRTALRNFDDRAAGTSD